MIRRQIYLPKSLYHQLQLTAQQRNQSVSEMVRELLETALSQQLANRRSAGESLLGLSKIGGRGPTDLSEKLDDYLYGEDIN